MTRQEAIKIIDCYDIGFYDLSGAKIPADKLADAFDMAIEALEKEPIWIPVSWHEITEEERIENGYPKDWVVYLDCKMPSDEQEILVTTRYGTVEKDVCYEDGEFSLDSGYDWIDDIIAWMPLPELYKEVINK